MPDEKRKPPAHEEDEEDYARVGQPGLDAAEREIFRRALEVLNAAGVRYMVSGAYAKYVYTQIWRDTKDLDLFLPAGEVKKALGALSGAQFETEVTAQHWLAKACEEPYLVDLIFGMSNGRMHVDAAWFAHARSIEIAGVDALLLPLEELIASKAFVCDRYRFDGADVVHLIQASKGQVDWGRVLALLGDNRGILLWHFMLFQFVYPGQAEYLPAELMDELYARARSRRGEADPRAFRGTLLDARSFWVDVADWGYEDPRDLTPLVDKEGNALPGAPGAS